MRKLFLVILLALLASGAFATTYCSHYRKGLSCGAMELDQLGLEVSSPSEITNDGTYEIQGTSETITFVWNAPPDTENILLVSGFDDNERNGFYRWHGMGTPPAYRSFPPSIQDECRDSPYAADTDCTYTYAKQISGSNSIFDFGIGGVHRYPACVVGEIPWPNTPVNGHPIKWDIGNDIYDVFPDLPPYYPESQIWIPPYTNSLEDNVKGNWFGVFNHCNSTYFDKGGPYWLNYAEHWRCINCEKPTGERIERLESITYQYRLSDDSPWESLGDENRIEIEVSGTGEKYFGLRALYDLNKDAPESNHLNPPIYDACSVPCDEQTFIFELLSCTDNDDDGYGNPASTICEYPEQDCNDDDGQIFPGAEELCNGKDDDCDGLKDEDFQCVKGSEGCTDECKIAAEETNNLIQKIEGKILGSKKINILLRCKFNAVAELDLNKEGGTQINLENQEADCNTSIKTTTLKTTEDLNSNTLYTLTATIPKPCSTCKKTVYLESTLPENNTNEKSIPDNNPIIVLFTVLIITILFRCQAKEKV